MKPINYCFTLLMLGTFFCLQTQTLNAQKKHLPDSTSALKNIIVKGNKSKASEINNVNQVNTSAPLKSSADTSLPESLKNNNAVAAPAADSELLDRITTLEQQVSDQKPGDDHFMVVGLATFGFVSNRSVNTLAGVIGKTKSNSFPDAGRFEFSPMLLWRHGKKILLEFEPSFNNGGLSVNWADVSYFAAPGLILRAGYFVLPFGFYNKHLAAGWIGKLASDPIGIGSPPSSDYGIEVEGGLPLGNMKWNYDVALTNGMQLMSDGQIQSAGINDNNKNKTFSGRLGLLPFSNSSLELGVSALRGKVADVGAKFQNATAHMYALDLNFVKNIAPFQLNIKSQYNLININRQDFVNPGDSTQTYTFNNKTTSAYAQISARPILSKNNIIKNFELAFRYANFTTPTNSLFGQNANQIDIGLEYWVNWRSVLKLTHETLTSNSRINQIVGADGGKTVSNSWYLQFSIQL